MKKKGAHTLSCFIFLIFSSSLFATETESLILDSFKDLKQMSHKSGYSESISDLYLGYDDHGNIQKGAAVRKFKSYEQITAVLVIEKKEGNYVVSYVNIPDMETIKEADKLGNIKKAISDFQNKILKDSSGNKNKVDIVSGATRYFSNIYASLNMMGIKIIEEIENNPQWPKSKLQ